MGATKAWSCGSVNNDAAVAACAYASLNTGSRAYSPATPRDKTKAATAVNESFFIKTSNLYMQKNRPAQECIAIESHYRVSASR